LFPGWIGFDSIGLRGFEASSACDEIGSVAVDAVVDPALTSNFRRSPEGFPLFCPVLYCTGQHGAYKSREQAWPSVSELAPAPALALAGVHAVVLVLVVRGTTGAFELWLLNVEGANEGCREGRLRGRKRPRPRKELRLVSLFSL
jgi:hypothetical protein